jgi:hypothetical protein
MPRYAARTTTAAIDGMVFDLVLLVNYNLHYAKAIEKHAYLPARGHADAQTVARMAGLRRTILHSKR